MVEQQIRTWDVFDPSLLSAFHGIPRHLFVPKEYADVAYADTEIPLPHGQCMLRPNIVGRMLQAVKIVKSDRVLEVGPVQPIRPMPTSRAARNVTARRSRWPWPHSPPSAS